MAKILILQAPGGAVASLSYGTRAEAHCCWNSSIDPVTLNLMHAFSHFRHLSVKYLSE